MTKIPTITKKDVAKRTAKLVGEKIYVTEKTVDGVFTALVQTDDGQSDGVNDIVNDAISKGVNDGIIDGVSYGVKKQLI